MSTCINPSHTAKLMHSLNTIMAHLDTGMLNDDHCLWLKTFSVYMHEERLRVMLYKWTSV